MTKKEYLVVIYAINEFRHYIIGYQVFVYIDHSAIRYLANKPITNGRVTWWLFLLQEFDITIKDRPAKENLVADFLSQILKVNDPLAVDDQFPDEHMFSVAVKMSWYVDVANYLVVGRLPKHLTTRERKLIVQRNVWFSWIGRYIFHTGRTCVYAYVSVRIRSMKFLSLSMMNPARDISQTEGHDTRYYKWVIIGPLFLRMLKNMPWPAIVSKRWASLANLMKCLCSHN